MMNWWTWISDRWDKFSKCSCCITSHLCAL